MMHRYSTGVESVTAPETKEEFLQHMRRYDFLHIAFTDINGVTRTIVMPPDRAPHFLEKGHDSVIAITSFAMSGEVSLIKDHIQYNFGNINLRPIIGTLTSWPSLGQSSSARIGQVLCAAHWLNGKPMQVDTRAMAVRQIQRLKDRGLDIYSGTEVEFRLFEKPQSSTSNEELRPAHGIVNMFLPQHYKMYEKFYVEMGKRLRSLGIKYTSIHTEYGRGQLEMPLAPEWGIQAADNLVRYKLLAHDTADDCGYCCSFMTKPLGGDNGNGFHFNHSIWSRTGSGEAEEEETPKNVMLDNDDPDKLSAFARHWTAGMMHHGNALAAILSPTVNCYRRLHTPWAPDHNDWAIDDRLAAIRIKNGGTPGGTLVENRTPSSASNPYLVMASIIAAGLDGVDRNLELPKQHSKEFGLLPKSLPEALEALQEDEVLCEALGEQFIDWFMTVKRKEVEDLKDINLSQNYKADFQRERAKYFFVA